MVSRTMKKMADGCMRRRQALWSAALAGLGRNVRARILGRARVAQQKVALGVSAWYWLAEI
jgi:hypothetical protein